MITMNTAHLQKCKHRPKREPPFSNGWEELVEQIKTRLERLAKKNMPGLCREAQDFGSSDFLVVQLVLNYTQNQLDIYVAIVFHILSGKQLHGDSTLSRCNIRWFPLIFQLTLVVFKFFVQQFTRCFFFVFSVRLFFVRSTRWSCSWRFECRQHHDWCSGAGLKHLTWKKNGMEKENYRLPSPNAFYFSKRRVFFSQRASEMI